MAKPLVYLAGPIAGTLETEAYDWRETADIILAQHGIETLSPMRGKDALQPPDGERISTTFKTYENQGVFFTSRGIMTRDHTDVLRADALLVNLLEAVRPSLGTVMELAWAYAYRKPVVVAIERNGNVHDNHPMIHEAISFRVETLYDAIDAVALILNR